jgi:hypothetical protein
MIKLIKGKYSLFFLLKDCENKDYIFSKKGDNGMGGETTIVKKNLVTVYNKDGKILYQGINHVDCFYKPFSILVFLDTYTSALSYYLMRRLRYIIREKY